MNGWYVSICQKRFLNLFIVASHAPTLQLKCFLQTVCFKIFLIKKWNFLTLPSLLSWPVVWPVAIRSLLGWTTRLKKTIICFYQNTSTEWYYCMLSPLKKWFQTSKEKFQIKSLSSNFPIVHPVTAFAKCH